MRDMVPYTDRSIRNIPVSGAHRRAPLYEDERPLSPMDTGRRPPPRRRRGGRKFLIIGIIVVVICAIGGLLLSTLFAGATVTVFPREAKVTVPPTIIAQPNAPVGSLSYEVMTVTRSASTTVQATGTKQVSRAASGVITVYNTFGAETQRLIANTRFEAPDGKMYRVRDSIVVPGTMTGVDGKVVPGRTSATVYADTPGASYNRGQTRFTVPGFKGDPRYDKFYAEGSAITGGYIGPEPAVAPTDLSKAREALQQGLAQAAQSTLGSQIPQGYLPVPGTIQVTYSELSQTAGTGSTAILSQSASMSAAIISQSALAYVIAKQTVSGYAGEAVAFLDPSAIIVSAATSTKLSDGRITLQLSGSPTLVWQYDPKALQEALLGKDKNEFKTIIQSFAPSIAKAEAKIRPFWNGSFPSISEDITIEAGTE